MIILWETAYPMVSFLFLSFFTRWFVAWHTFGVGAILEYLLRTTYALQLPSLSLNLPKRVHVHDYEDDMI